jgi:hypothetical protein
MNEAQEMLEHSDDHDCSCSYDRYNCEKNIQQISHGDVIQVVFHGGPFRFNPKPKIVPQAENRFKALAKFARADRNGS